MPPARNFVVPGQRFGMFTVIEETRRVIGGRPRRAVQCRCDCGNSAEVLLHHLLAGRSASCGCRRQEFGRRQAQSPDRLARLREHSTVHGVAGHPLYSTYRDMVARCHDPERKDYANYGGRGIEVFADWRSDPAAFINWIEANIGPRPEGMTLDRIDNKRGYEPGNLRWATWHEQRVNQRPREVA